MNLLSRSALTTFALSSICLGFSSADFCLEKTLETKPVRRSYLKKVQSPKTYTCCPNLSCDPPICTKYVTTMEKKWKVEMVTARVTRKKCCPGYSAEGETCQPLCPGGCIHGKCSAPRQCTCSAGYRGHSCELYGCPPHTWGVGCQRECLCQHFGSCDPATGECTCPPGYEGDRCQDATTTITYTDTPHSNKTSTITSTTTTSTTTTSTTTTTTSTATTTTIILSTTSSISNISLSSVSVPDENPDLPVKEKISAKMILKPNLIPEDLLIVLLSSLLFLLFITAVILTIVYCRCRMRVMRDKHISREMDRNRKTTMKNDYVKKMAAAKVNIKDYHKENLENENLQDTEESLINFDENEYTPMNLQIERSKYDFRKLT